MKTDERKRSPGKVKDSRAGKNCKRSGKACVPADEQVRRGHLRRWPDKDTEDLYFALNTAKKQRGAPAKRIKPPAMEFPLMESLSDETRKKILLASSLEVKKVKRHPGWVLSRVYNLKNRPIEFI